MSGYQPHIVAGPNECQVSYPSHVGITKVQFSPEYNSRNLVVSGWDGTVRVFDTTNTHEAQQRLSYFHGKPVFACTFAVFLFSHVEAVLRARIASQVEDSIRSLRWLISLRREVGRSSFLSSTAETTLGNHGNAVRCMEFSRQGVLVTGGWDSLVKAWDPRATGAIHTVPASDRVYALDVFNEKLIVGTRDRRILVWDVRKMTPTPLQDRESPLKYQTRAVKCFPSGDAFVVASIEGRVAVEYFSQDADEQKKKYAFKCHRVKEATGGPDGGGVEYIHPVNAISFHPIFNTFATGGSDAMVNIWDPFNRKRLCQLHKFQTSIMSLSFNSDGTQLAIASSYGYELENDPVPMPENSVIIRKISEIECRPK